jgi:biopolymer transport protein ExbD
MLVLLIIFMVAAPLAAPSVEVKLPRAVAPLAPNPPTPIYISITADGQAYLGDGALELDQIGSELTAQIGRRSPADERIFIRADKSTRYGDFMQVMNSLQDNGFYSVALVGEDTDVQ